jgi:hypothetical protein
MTDTLMVKVLTFALDPWETRTEPFPQPWLYCSEQENSLELMIRTILPADKPTKRSFLGVNEQLLNNTSYLHSKVILSTSCLGLEFERNI